MSTTKPTSLKGLYDAMQVHYTSEEGGGLDKEVAEKRIGVLKAKLAAEDIDLISALKSNLTSLGLTAGMKHAIEQIMQWGEFEQKVTPAAGQSASGTPPVAASTVGSQHITVSLDKSVHDLDEDELIKRFATGTRTAEVQRVAKDRFGKKRMFVLNGDNTINLEKTLQRLNEDDNGKTYEGLYVGTVQDVLNREFAADPLNRTKLSKAFKAEDGVTWPAEPKARLFVIYCRHEAPRKVQANMSTQQRDLLAKSLLKFPNDIPSYLEEEYTLFDRAYKQKQPIISSCEGEMAWQDEDKKEEEQQQVVSWGGRGRSALESGAEGDLRSYEPNRSR